jgi:hypothetical protein
MSLTQILALAGAATLVALTVASIPTLAPIRPYQRIFLDLDRQIGECQLHRRAISRRACLAGLRHEMHIETAENR